MILDTAKLRLLQGYNDFGWILLSVCFSQIIVAITFYLCKLQSLEPFLSNCQGFLVEVQLNDIIMLQIQCYKIVKYSEIITFYSGLLFGTNKKFLILNFLKNADFVLFAALL